MRVADAFVIGIDFGTLSARAVLADARNGDELGSAAHEYASGVIEGRLPGTKAELKAKSALQDPADYLAALEVVVPAVLKKAKVRAESVVGIATIGSLG